MLTRSPRPVIAILAGLTLALVTGCNPDGTCVHEVKQGAYAVPTCQIGFSERACLGDLKPEVKHEYTFTKEDKIEGAKHCRRLGFDEQNGDQFSRSTWIAPSPVFH